MRFRLYDPHFVRKKGIQGFGIYTTKPFAKGEILFKLRGEILPFPTRTSIQIGENKHIEDQIGGFINHSCNPSAKVDKRNGTFVSLRNLKAGEEITFDYNKNEDKMASPFICKCCGKKIAGKMNVEPQQLKKITY